MTARVRVDREPPVSPASGQKRKAGRVRIGISGWRYKPWRGVFYPPKLQQRRELEFASRIFDTIEINGTFYSLQRPASFEQWAQETPEGFVFSIKGSRYITHMKKLRGVEQAFANLLASGPLALGPKFGPMLWQFPPQQRYEPERFEAFFRSLPRSTAEAARIAETCDDRMLSRSVLSCAVDIPMQHVVEIRHESFATPEFVEFLRTYQVGLVVADTVEWPLLLDVTAPVVYLRLHGSEVLYASGYSDEALDLWAERVVTWARGGTPAEIVASRRVHPVLAKAEPRDVFVYFDNDVKARAPFDAQGLRSRVDRLLAI